VVGAGPAIQRQSVLQRRQRVRLAVVAIVLVAGCGAKSTPDRATSATPDRAVQPTTSPWLEKVQISDLRLWRYDPDADRWTKVPDGSMQYILMGQPRSFGPDGGMPVNALLARAAPIGLYWVRFTENGLPRDGFIFRGPVKCNDIEIGEPPAGKVAACVPFKDSARAQFVPDPCVHCK
jgi:hypothetical protein